MAISDIQRSRRGCFERSHKAFDSVLKHHNFIQTIFCFHPFRHYSMIIFGYAVIISTASMKAHVTLFLRLTLNTFLIAEVCAAEEIKRVE